LSRAKANALASRLAATEVAIHGKSLNKEEFVTCGGVKLAEVNFKTMESRITPRLYFAGELLDIDGLTGGFNFQAAWTTGWIAGHAMRSEEHTSELQSRGHLVCRLLLEKKKRHLGHPRERRARARQGGAPAATALEEEPVGALERRDRLAAEAAPAEPHQVEAAQAGPVARHHAEGRHVHRHHRPRGAQGRLADADVLVHAR